MPNRPPQVNLTQQQQPPPPQQPRTEKLALSDLGIQIEPEPRLVVMLAALDAAGWEPTPEGAEPSIFRQMLRKDLASLDPALRARMQEFYRRHKLDDAHATSAEQAANYVSLAYTLGPAPGFETPPRSDDLPAGALDVFDFAPLVRDFYRAARMDERLPTYLQMHRAEADTLRAASIEMGYSVLHYLNTQPVKTFTERIVTEGRPATTNNKKNGKAAAQKETTYREHERRFHIVPALLAAPGAINLRVIADDYYVIVPARTDSRASGALDPRSTGLRRAYIQYLIDPLVIRHSREIALKRAEIKTVLDAERERAHQDITPDVYLTVSRSLVSAADTRMEETARLRELQLKTSARLTAARDEATHAAILRESKDAQQAIEDTATAALAESYERGAVLDFYFAEQLRGIESSGFDIATFITDMISSISPAHELTRPAEYATAVTRDREARKKAQQQARERDAASDASLDEARATLFKRLGEVDDLLLVNNYTEAEARLLSMRDQYKNEPRVYFGLGRAAGLSAQDAFDETVQAERLNRALEHYRQATLLASPETDAALLSRAYVARGRILAFLDRKEEAAREFDAAIKLQDVPGGAYKEALAAKQGLANKQP